MLVRVGTRTSDMMSSPALSELFTKKRDLRSGKNLVTNLPATLSVFKHDDNRIMFVCEPWGPGVASILAVYEFGTRSGSYKIRPEFYIDGGIGTTKSASVVMLDRSFYDMSLSEFLSEVEDGIAGSSCVISSDASCAASSNMRLEFRGHDITRTYKDDKVLYMIDQQNDTADCTKVFSISPAADGKECIVRYILDEGVSGIVTEMIKIS